MPDLLDLLGWSDAVEWVPIYKWYGDLASMIQDDLCRDCGCKSGYNQGGAGQPQGSSYMVCDDCAKLDECLTRKHDRGPEWHVSYWGDPHRADEHDALITAQARRRARYRAKHLPE